MILRLCFIMTFFLCANPLFPRDPFPVINVTNREKYQFRKTDHFNNLPFLLKDTLSQNGGKQSFSNNTSKGNKWLNAAYIPAGLITSGLVTMAVPENTMLSKYTIQQRITGQYPGFSTKADNYLQLVPGVAVFGLKAMGVKSRSDFLNQSIIFAKSQLLTLIIVQSLKIGTHIERPDGSSYHSMPSGHTTEAFMLATMLDMEYRDVSPWISVGGYAAATATGALRMLNNRHWISDVLVGAGIGIFTTKFVYFTHQYRWGKNNNRGLGFRLKTIGEAIILPAIYKNGGGFICVMTI